MKHVAAALLLSAAGKEVTEKSITEVLSSVGIKPDTKVVAMVAAACKGKKPEQIVAEGLTKLSAAVAVVAVAASTDKKVDAKKDAPKKKEPEPEPEEEIGFGDLF